MHNQEISDQSDNATQTEKFLLLPYECKKRLSLHAQSTNTVKCNFGIRPNPLAQAGIDCFAVVRNSYIRFP